MIIKAQLSFLVSKLLKFIFPKHDVQTDLRSIIRHTLRKPICRVSYGKSKSVSLRILLMSSRLNSVHETDLWEMIFFDQRH